MFAIPVLGNRHRNAFINPFAGDEVGRIHEKLEGYLEHAGHFEGIELEFDTRGNESDHGRHGKSGNDSAGLEEPGELNLGRPQADFFGGFAQRRVLGAGIARIDPARPEN